MPDDPKSEQSRPERLRFVLDESWQTSESRAVSKHRASRRGAQAAETASYASSPPRGLSSHVVTIPHGFYTDRKLAAQADAVAAVREGHGQDPAQDGAQMLPAQPDVLLVDAETIEAATPAHFPLLVGARSGDGSTTFTGDPAASQRPAQALETASQTISRTDALFGSAPTRPNGAVHAVVETASNETSAEQAFMAWFDRACRDDGNPAGLRKLELFARSAFLAGAEWALL